MKDFINIKGNLKKKKYYLIFLKGELKNEDMKAFIGDHLISCTIVINDFNLHLFKLVFFLLKKILNFFIEVVANNIPLKFQ